MKNMKTLLLTVVVSGLVSLQVVAKDLPKVDEQKTKEVKSVDAKCSLVAYDSKRDKAFVASFLTAHDKAFQNIAGFNDLDQPVSYYEQKYKKHLQEEKKKNTKQVEKAMLTGTRTMFKQLDNFPEDMQKMQCARFGVEDVKQLKEAKDEDLLKVLRKDAAKMEKVMDKMQLFLKQHCMVALDDNKKPVGFVRFFDIVGAQVFVAQVGVAEANRKQGIGTKLLKHVDNHAKKDGSIRVTLSATDDNKAAKALYAKAGFKQLPNPVFEDIQKDQKTKIVQFAKEI